MRAFTGLGRQREAAAFLRWLLHATALTQPRLGVVYDVFGRANLSEWEVENLSGYRASKPVRVGNAAHKQMQLDVYGAVVTAAAEFVAAGGSLQHDQKKRSEEHTSELQSLMRISYAVFCLKKQTKNNRTNTIAT